MSTRSSPSRQPARDAMSGITTATGIAGKAAPAPLEGDHITRQQRIAEIEALIGLDPRMPTHHLTHYLAELSRLRSGKPDAYDPATQDVLQCSHCHTMFAVPHGNPANLSLCADCQEAYGAR